MDKLLEEINLFFNFISSEKARIMQLQIREEDRRILLLSLLEVLAKAVYPNNKLNKSRFTNLIDNYSDWEDKDRISLIQLQYLLNESPDQKYANLKEEIDNKISQLEEGRLYRLHEVDPKMDELFVWFSTPYEKDIIEKAKHANLLRIFRNMAVHEYREPGKGMALSNDNSTPYYHGASVSDYKDKTRELVYHSQFIGKLTDGIADKLKRYFMNSKINPYDSFRFSSNWFHK